MAGSEPLKLITTRLSDPRAGLRACLIICPDTVRQGRVVERLRSGLSSSAEIIKIDAASTSEEGLRKIFFSLQNNSLFASENHLIISNLDAFTAAVAKTFVSLLKETGPSTVVIATAPKLSSTLSLYKFFDQEKVIFSLAELSGAELEKWIAKEMTQAGIEKFPAVAAGIIRQASQESPDMAVDIIHKMALYLDGEPLTLADLKALVPIEAHVDEFDFVSRIATTPRARLELMMSQLLNQGVSPFPLLGLLHRNYATYHALNQLLKSGLSPDQCARRIDSPPWLIKKIAPLAQKYSLAELKQCLGAIARADSLMKNRSLGHESIMSELLETLAP